jgi:hypothetical protein
VKFGAWLKGLAAALIGGVVTGVAQAAASNNMNASQLKGAVIAGALLTAGAYLTKSPFADAAAPGSTPAADPAPGNRK